MGRLDHYSKEARQALAYAREEAKHLRQRIVGPEHVLLGILHIDDPDMESIWASLHVGPIRLRTALEFVVEYGSKALLSEPSLSAVARTVLAHAEQEATAMKVERVGPEHLLLGILAEPAGCAAGVLASFGVSLEHAQQAVLAKRSGAARGEEYRGRGPLSRAPGRASPDGLHLYERDGAVGADGVEDCEERHLGDGVQTPCGTLSGGQVCPSILHPHAYQSSYDATPILNRVSRDLTAAALSGTLDPLIGRATELERTMQILCRRSKNNPVLIGPAGVGKTAIAEGLARRIVCGQVPGDLRQCRVVALDIGLLTVGTRFRGDFEERLKGIMQEILNVPGIILVIDELHTLVNNGVAEGSLDAANLFKPMLVRGEFRCIGATTLTDYQRTIEADPALERRFQQVMVAETSLPETLEVVQGLRAHYEDFHDVTITDAALVAAVNMSSRYIMGRYQPDNAIDVLDEAASRVCMQHHVLPEPVRRLRAGVVAAQQAKDEAIGQQNYALASQERATELRLYQELCEAEYDWVVARQQNRSLVGEQQVAEVVAMATGIPVTQLTTLEAERLLRLEQELHTRLIGQHEAVQAVARAIRRSRTSLRDSHRPIGSFLFVGPTGVGKTALAKALAAVLFDDESALIEFDMSGFIESHSVSRLIGAPPGYIGYEQAGQLTEAVRRRPYSIVLFDEVEKAHPEVFDLFLQMLEDGCLTDSHGQKVSFRHTVIIMTSNIGSTHRLPARIAFAPDRVRANEGRAETYDRSKEQVMPAIKDALKPELLNRIDEIVCFPPLTREQLREIANLMVAQTRQRLAAKSITLQVTAAALDLLVERSYEPQYGARPLRRLVQSMLDDLLAESLLQGAFTAGDMVVADAADGKLCIRKPMPAPAAIGIKTQQLLLQNG